MSRRKQQNDADEPEITAQPKGRSALASHVVEEKGLPIAPEDMGAQFLVEATEQGNFESSLGGDNVEITVPGAPPSDDSVPPYEARGNVWDRTVDAAVEGDAEAALRASPPGTEQNQGVRAAADEDLSLIEDDLDEASLLDDEGEELGEVREPHVDADDSGARTRRLARRQRTL